MSVVWLRVLALSGMLSAIGVGDAGAADPAEVHGAGSTFVAPIMTRWASAYAGVSGVQVVYDSVGSGAGIERIRSGQVDFGATDKPLTPEELEESGLSQFPIVIGGVVPVVNLPGIAAGQLRFSGRLLGDIFLGRIARWDAPEIKALNPDATLPATPIAVIHRSDGSGTTYNWVDFLAKTNSAWKREVGVGLAVRWPVGVGQEGNAGVAGAVMATAGSIGYVEYAYAVRSKLVFGQVRNGYGLFVSPEPDAFQAAAATVNWRQHKDFSVLLTNAAGPDAYPITAATFILMHRTPARPGQSAAALGFFKWALEAGGEQASSLDYVPIPPRLVRLIEAYWQSSIPAMTQ